MDISSKIQTLTHCRTTRNNKSGIQPFQSYSEKGMIWYERYASNAAQADSTVGLNHRVTNTYTLMEKHTCLQGTLITSDGKSVNHILPTDISEQIPTSVNESTPVSTHEHRDCELMLPCKATVFAWLQTSAVWKYFHRNLWINSHNKDLLHVSIINALDTTENYRAHSCCRPLTWLSTFTSYGGGIALVMLYWYSWSPEDEFE